MDYLTKILGTGTSKAGGVALLEDAIGVPRKTVSMVKSGSRGLPLEACYKLADLTGADLVRLIAENEAITAKAEKAEFWRKKLKELEAVAAVWIFALVTTVVTPSPAEATEYSKPLILNCILCKIIDAVKIRIRNFLGGLGIDSSTTSKPLACSPS